MKEKKKFFRYLFCILTILLIWGCTQKEKGITYSSVELKVSKNSVNANGEDYALLTAIVLDSEGNTVMDIQNEVGFYYIDEENPDASIKLVTNRFLSKKEGKYRIYAEIEDVKSQEINMTARQNPVVSKIELTTDKNEIAIDNTDMATLSVKVLNQYNEIMVTETDSNIEYYMNGNKISSNKVTLSKMGTNKIKVKYGGIESNEITINSKIYIDNLSTSLKNINFASNTTSYDVGEFIYDTSSFTLTATSTDSKAILTYKINENNWVNMPNGQLIRDLKLDVGNNLISIKIQSEDKSLEKIYTISAYRKNNGYNLTTLELSGASIEFKPDTTYYEVVVSSLTTSIAVTATSENEKNKLEYKATTQGTYSVLKEGQKSEDIPMIIGDNVIYVRVTAEDTQYTKLYTIKITRLSEKDCVLKTLSVTANSKELLAGFEASTLTYDLSVDFAVSNIFINATKNNEDSILSGELGSKDLKVGNNVFYIKVTTLTIEKTYTLNVYRKNNNTLLSGISLSNGEIQFKPETLSYTMYVMEATEKIAIKTKKSDSNQKKIEMNINAGDYTEIEYDKLTDEITLLMGENIIELKVYAEDTSYSRIYTLKIIRGLSGDNLLTKLSIKTDGKELLENFEPLTLNYTVNVPNTTTTLNITATANATAIASGDIGEMKIVSEDTTLKITVQAQNGSEQNYYVKIHKLNGDAFLKELNCSAGTIENFQAMSLNYDIGKISNNVESITILPVANSQLAKIEYRVNNGIWDIVKSGEISLPQLLTTGENLIYVRVIAEDAITTNTYTIKLKRMSNNIDMSNISSQDLTFEFNPLGTIYDCGTIENSKDIIKIIATSKEANSKLEIKVNSKEWQLTENNKENSVALDVGNNIIYIRVTSEDGSLSKLYTFKVKRASDEARLSSIQFSSANIAFNEDVYEYQTQMLASALEKINVTPITKQSNSKIEYKINAADYKTVESQEMIEIPLITGQNRLLFKVTAEDTQYTKTYTIIIKRANSNCNLVGITSTAGILSFKKETQNYDLGKVENQIKTIGIKADIEDNNGKIEMRINNSAYESVKTGEVKSFSLNTGNNVIDIKITAEDTAISKVYQLNISRKSNNSSLKDITSSTGTLKFVSETYTYNLGVVASTLNEIEIVATKAEETENVMMRINGKTWNTGVSQKITLETGDNTIEVKAVSEDETSSKIYTLKVRKTNNNITLSNLIVPGLNTFDPLGATTYTLANKPYTTSSLSIKAIAEDENAIVKYSENGGVYQEVGAGATATLTVGDNNIYIKVFAEDRNITKTFLIKIRRLNNNTTLERVECSSGKFEFNPAVYTYDMGTVSSAISTIKFLATLKDKNAKLQYKKPNMIWQDLQSGKETDDIAISEGKNEIALKVISEDEENNSIYTFKITRSTCNVNLAKLETNIGNVVLENTKTSYDLNTVPYTTKLFTVSAMAVDSATKVEMKFEGNEYQTLNKISGEIPEGESKVYIKVTAQDNSVSQIYTVKVKRLSGNVKINTLELSNTTIKFSESISQYDTTVQESINRIGINVILSALTSKVKVRNNLGAWTYINSNYQDVTLEYGYNQIELEVIAEDETITKRYVFNILRDINLKSFNVGGTSQYVTILPNINSYELSMGGEQKEYNVNATAESGIIIEGMPMLYNIVDGYNIVQVVISSVNGYKKTYTFKVYKMSNDTSINGISITEGFASRVDDTNYTVTVPYDTKETSIQMLMNDSKATQDRLTKQVLVPGDNKFDVMVTAEDGTEKIYRLNITRQQKDTSLLSCSFANETSFKKKLVFDPTVLTYDVEACATAYKGTGQVALNFTAKDATNVIKINGDIINGNKTYINVGNLPGLFKITIEVIPEEGKSTIYTINLKKLSNEARLKSVFIGSEIPVSKVYNYSKDTYLGADMATAFNSDIYQYQIYGVGLNGDAVKNFKITQYVLMDSSCTVNTSFILDDGSWRYSSKYTITIISEDQTTTKIYTFIYH